MQPLKYILPGCEYINLKTGDPYQVFQQGSHSETEESLIVYVSAKRSLSLKHHVGLLLLQFASRLLQERVWIRPIESFATKFREPEKSK